MTPIEVELEHRWHTFWTSIGGDGDGSTQWNIIRACYTAPGRFYHTLHHLMHCFAWLDTYRGRIPLKPGASTLIEAILWFHDTVSIPGNPLNEFLSAQHAQQVCSDAYGLSRAQSRALYYGILSTRNHRSDRIIGPREMRKQLDHSRTIITIALDCDLAILGEDWQTYRRYTAQLRREYGNISDADFTAGRLAFLREFAKRKAIYGTDFFYDRLEEQARANIAREIAQLERKLAKPRPAA